MAVRRPPAPHLRAGRPGTPVRPGPAAPAPLKTPAPPTTPAPAPAAPAAGPAWPGPARTGRRALLLGGAAAAVGGAVGAGALLRRGEEALPTAASLGAPAPGSTARAPFDDVPADDPAADAIRWADETGVQPALSPAEYSPRGTVTRADVALALHRLAGAPPVDVDAAPVLLTDLGEDPDQVAALLWLHGRGALWGDAELRVHPEEPATRDCTASMLTGLVRPALAGRGVTWDASAEASVPQAEDPGSAVADVAWLEAAGIAPASLSLADWSGEDAVTRAELALSLHRADTVITEALGADD